MIRSKARLHKSIPLFFLLASAASLATAAEGEKRGFREEVRQMAQNARPAAGASAVEARSDRPARTADRGRDGDRDGRRGNHSRGNDGGGRRHDADRGRGGNRDGRRYDNDRRGSRDGVGRDGVGRDRGRRDGRRDEVWQSDRNRGSWGHDGRRDRHDRYDRHSRHERRFDDRRGHGGRHHSWNHGYRGRRAWHDSHLRNGFYFRAGRFLDLSFHVPSFLTIDYDPRYEEYYYGSVFHPGYGRDFEVFLFPTYYNDRVEYIPYAYGDGRLYGRGRMLNGGGSLSIRFDF